MRVPRKLFQDSIAVNIPLHVTADLGVALRRTREKRIKAIYEHFPELRKDQPTAAAAAAGAEEGNDDNDDKKQEDPKKKKKPGFIPQKEQFGSVLDYLEAKYVRGVMLDDDEEGGGGGSGSGGGAEEGDVDDDKRSVYSESSFLDDSQLKRDVAEQFLSHTTQTKLELENHDDDFFVNVGNLEVEDHDLMDYDPLDDEKIKAPKKRKRPSDKNSASKKSKTPAKKTPNDSKNKKQESGNSSAKKSAQKKKGRKETTVMSEELKQKIEEAKKRAQDLKAVSDQKFQDTKDHVESMTDKELPRKKKNEKVSITVPDGKNPGDDITFSNPHNPGQKLRVKVPKNTSAGEKFVVSVPVAAPDSAVDNNKFNREIQEKLDDFSHAYDEWCHAEAAYRELDPNNTKKFNLHHQRMNKFEAVIKVFPDDLVTPIDAGYLRKVVRRARQNKHKRNKTAQKLQAEAAKLAAAEATKGDEKEVSPAASPMKPKEATAAQEEVKVPMLTLHVPGKGTEFPSVNLED